MPASGKRAAQSTLLSVFHRKKPRSETLPILILDSSEEEKEEKEEKEEEEEEEEEPPTTTTSPSPPSSPSSPANKVRLAGNVDKQLSDVVLLPRFLDARQATARMEDILGEVHLESVDLFVFNKVHATPRLTGAFTSIPGYTYHYSNRTHAARSFPASLLRLRNDVEDALGLARATFNFALVNLYRDGQDRIGAHRDAEAELDPAMGIASVSMGATRDFVFSPLHPRRDVRDVRDVHTARPARQRVVLPLPHGSLLYFGPRTNREWLHAVPPRKRISTPRLNITFRRFLPQHAAQSVASTNSE